MLDAALCSVWLAFACAAGAQVPSPPRSKAFLGRFFAHSSIDQCLHFGVWLRAAPLWCSSHIECMRHSRLAYRLDGKGDEVAPWLLAAEGAPIAMRMQI